MEGKSLPTLLFEHSPKDNVSHKKRKNNGHGNDFGRKRNANCLQPTVDASFWPFDVSQDAVLSDKTTEDLSSKENTQILNDLTQKSHPDDRVEYDQDEAKSTEPKDGRSDETFSEVLSQIGQEAKMAILQFSQALGESELFEQEGLQAISDLQEHAQVLEQSLMSRKETLCKRLKNISDSLNSEQ